MAHQRRNILDLRFGVETLEDETLLLHALVCRPPRILQPYEVASIAINGDVTTGGTSDGPVGREGRFADEEVASLPRPGGYTQLEPWPPRVRDGFCEHLAHVIEDEVGDFNARGGERK